MISPAVDAIAARIDRMAFVLASLERHLLAEQTAALMQPPAVDRDRVHTSGTTDPTANLVISAMGHRGGVYARTQAKLLSITDALAGINGSIDHMERTVAACISDRNDFDTTGIERCHGWTVELRARLGGCGNHLEPYTRADGSKGLRSMCSRCRKASGEARREAQGAA